MPLFLTPGNLILLAGPEADAATANWPAAVGGYFAPGYFAVGLYPPGFWPVGAPGQAVALAPDLLTTFWEALAADAGLEEAVGRPAEGENGWLWYDDNLPGPDIPRPLVILALDHVGESEPPSYDGDTVQSVWLRIDVWADGIDGRPTATRLARAIAEALDGRTTTLEWDGGIELFYRLDRPDPEPIPGGFGVGAARIVGVRLRVEFITQFNLYGIDDEE